MEELKMKVEPYSDEDHDALGSIQLMKNEEETLTLTDTCSTAGEADSLEERSSHIILKFGVTKREQEENYDRLPKKTETTLVREKTEPDALQQAGVISKFSDSDNDDNDLSSVKYIVMNVKKENEYQEDLQQIDPGLEDTSGDCRNFNRARGTR